MLLYQKPTRTIRVEVTQADIENGVRMEVGGCMVARALGRATGKKVLVCHHGFVFGEGERAGSSHRFPDGVAEKILMWDQTGTAKPFSFDVTIEEPAFAFAT